MTDPRITDERLRSWRQSQPERERLCISLLPMFGNYRDVRPRRPRGGPDGGRDIEAALDGGVVWGAVGFQELASDSRDSRAAAAKKFHDDLESACRENSSLYGFVFFTNVDLPPSMINELEKDAAAMGIAHVNILYRERLREKLDSTPGFGFRLQFLSISMTIEEQTSFVHHLSESQDARLAELTALLDALRASVLALESKAVTTMDAVRVHAERTIATITGGDSYCTLRVNDDSIVAVHVGGFPLYDLAVRIVDLAKPPAEWPESSIQLGGLIPGHAAIHHFRFAWSPGETRRANLFITARNGAFIQLLRGYEVSGKWLWAWRVIRDGMVLEETVPDVLKDLDHGFE